MAYCKDGTQRSAVPTNRALFAEATRQCQPYQSARAQCDLVRGRAWLQVARSAKRFGNWHTTYTRMNRWSKNGVLEEVRRTHGLSARTRVGLNSGEVVVRAIN